MFIIKDRQRLIGAVILSFFLSAVIIVVSDNGIPTQAYAKKKMIVSTPLSVTPSSLNDNSVLNDQNAIITTTNNSINYNNNNNNSSPNTINVQQIPDYNNNTNSSSYLIYEDHADGISLMYPSNWQKIEY